MPESPPHPSLSPMSTKHQATAVARAGRSARIFFLLAAVCGLLHAAPSFYWATGGRALLETVGSFAVELAESGEPGVTWMLIAVGLAKTAGALVPLLDHLRLPAHTWVRFVSWAGVAVLLAWGGAGMVGAWIGVLTREASWAQPAMVGHGLLWDPLFVVWGALLALALWKSSPAQKDARTMKPVSCRLNQPPGA